MKKLLVIFAILSALLSGCRGGQQTADANSAPDFTLPNSLGGSVSFSDYEGKNVLLFFHMAVG